MPPSTRTIATTTTVGTALPEWWSVAAAVLRTRSVGTVVVGATEDGATAVARSDVGAELRAAVLGCGRETELLAGDVVAAAVVARRVVGSADRLATVEVRAAELVARGGVRFGGGGGTAAVS
jgi:phosphosulfolactate phosphohydrolase-like enzyme